LRRKRGIHVNPWSHFPRLITSIDFLKRERPLRSFRETLRGGEEATYPRPVSVSADVTAREGPESLCRAPSPHMVHRSARPRRAS
jgi:hypothetical protein